MSQNRNKKGQWSTGNNASQLYWNKKKRRKKTPKQKQKKTPNKAEKQNKTNDDLYHDVYWCTHSYLHGTQKEQLLPAGIIETNRTTGFATETTADDTNKTLDHSFVLCQDCVAHEEGKEQNKKAKEDEKEVEENTEIIVKKADQNIANYISSLNLENIELDHDECFPILNSIPRCGLIKYCDHFGIRYSTRSKDMILLRKVTKHFILYNRCKNNNRSIDDIERRVFGHCCAS
eukprot:385355_1